MADYIYLLEHRLSADQRNALRQLREAAREAEMLLFLTGDAVRDLTSGHAVRDLEVAVHGNALKLKKIIEKAGGKVWGEDDASKTLYLCFPGTVRVDVVSTHRVEYPKPGKAVLHADSIQEDLRRRDFTVNAMAISLNEGSFGLLMDPMNGAADIEARTLRLVSNYGFLEDPSLLIRATRYLARLGWELDPKTKTRYENALGEGVIEHLSDMARCQELEQIGHEEEGLKVLQALETESWMKVLFPAWTAAKADAEKLTALHNLVVELLMQGVRADVSAAQMQLLTAKLAAKDLAALKKMMLRPGFVEEWNNLDSMAARFAKVLLAKENATPSAGYKLFTTYDPEAVLWLGFTTKDAAVKERFNQFLKVWPEARQRLPHALMQEMRITPELAGYNEIVQSIFLELIDGRLTAPEEMRAFLEPHSPPAPPPQVTIKRPRAKRGAEAKVKERSIDEDEDADEDLDEDDDVDDMGGDDDELDLGIAIPKVDLDADLGDDGDTEPAEEDVEEDEAESEDEAPVRRGAKGTKEAPKKRTQAENSVRPAKVGKTAAPVTPAPQTPVAKPIPPAPVTPEKPALTRPSTKPEVKPANPAPKAPVASAAPEAKKPVARPVTAAAKGSKGGKPATHAAKVPAAKAPAPKAPAKKATHAVKPPAKSASKAAPHGKPAVGKTAVKAHGKSAHKPAAKKPAGKPAPARGKQGPSHSKTAKTSKTATPSKPTAKKPAAKGGKKR